MLEFTRRIYLPRTCYSVSWRGVVLVRLHELYVSISCLVSRRHEYVMKATLLLAIAAWPRKFLVAKFIATPSSTRCKKVRCVLHTLNIQVTQLRPDSRWGRGIESWIWTHLVELRPNVSSQLLTNLISTECETINVMLHN